MESISYTDEQFVKIMREQLTKKGLARKTIQVYPGSLKKLLILLNVKNITEAINVPIATYKQALQAITPSTRAAILASLLAIVKAFDMPSTPKIVEIQALSKEYRTGNKEIMKENVGEIPTNFDSQVDKYLKEKKGTLWAVLIALLTKTPTVRGHMYEGLKIARTKRLFNQIVKENRYPVIGTFGKEARFVFVSGNPSSPATVKIPSEREETIFSKELTDHIKKFIRKDQVFMFEPIKGALQYITTKTLQTWITEAFKDAGIPDMGIQKLRRIYETRISNNPSLSLLEKEKLSKQMNHSRMMGENYVVIPRGKSEQEQNLFDQIGLDFSNIMLQIAALKQYDNIKYVGALVSNLKAEISERIQKETRMIKHTPIVISQKDTRFDFN